MNHILITCRCWGCFYLLLNSPFPTRAASAEHQHDEDFLFNSRIISRPPAPLLQSRGSDFITVLLQSSVSHRQYVWPSEEISYTVQIRNESRTSLSGGGGFPTPWEAIGEDVHSHNNDYSASATASDLISTIGYRCVPYIVH